MGFETCRIVDAQQNPVCDVSVRIESGDEHIEKTLTPADCVFAGGASGPGTYKVIVQEQSTVLSEQEVVVPPVAEGECHMETQDVTITLSG